MPRNPRVTQAVGRLGGMRKHRPPDHPDVIHAEEALDEEILVNEIEKALRKAPPLTPERRARIVALLGS